MDPENVVPRLLCIHFVTIYRMGTLVQSGQWDEVVDDCEAYELEVCPSPTAKKQ